MTADFSTKHFGSAEYVAGLALLKTEREELVSQLKTKISADKIPPMPALKNGTDPASILFDFSTLNQHVFALRALVNLKATAPQPASQAPSSEKPQPQPGEKAKYDPDAAILAAKGVTSYAELAKLPVKTTE